MDFKSTLLMNKSKFEMRGGLAQKEPLLVQKWQDEQLYQKMNENRLGAEPFILHDGPPYANGDIHCGHVLNRLLKDFVIRHKNMQGYLTPFVLGWDTHGLPIENQVTKSGVNRKTTPIIEFRKKCEEYALLQVNRQKEEMLRLGIVGDVSHLYLTLQKEYEAKQIECFARMALNGLIYKGLKPVYWSPSSESALAEAEIEYHDIKSHSIYVAFDVKDGKGLLSKGDKVVIWTTTPWTLPANLAISAHPDFIYGLYDTNRGKLVFLKEFAQRLQQELDLGEIKLLKEFKGRDLDGVVCQHPFYNRDSLLIVGTHVTNETGTGLVHTAPGHGVEDYNVCLNYHIDPYCPVDEKGFLTKDAGERLSGVFYEDANDIVLQMLEENHTLLKHEVFTHSYPHDWRTNKPLIFRATNQWFCSIEPIRTKLLEQIDKTHWYPVWGKTRMVNMIKDRQDWCISRQRAWGVPIPIIYCEDGTPIIEKKVFDHIIDLIKENGSNVWYEKDAKDLLPEGYTNIHSPNGVFTKENDIMDVWFDSGSSFDGVLIARGQKYPADLYLEGNDQYRGWFNSSLIISTAVFDKAPYKNVVSHGFVVDENWDKMSKSKGNGINPNKIANVYGADILRLWAASVDYQQDVRISEGIINQVSEVYRKLRNTLKFMSWNLVDFNPKKLAKNYEKVDLFILARLEEVVKEVNDNFDRYDFASSVSELMTFLSTDLSAFYLDIAKDTLYCDRASSQRRNQIQSVIFQVSETVLRLLNPFLPFTMDEFNRNLPGKRADNVQLLDYPKSTSKYDHRLLEEYALFIQLRNDVLKALEVARSNQMIGSSQEAHVIIKINNDDIRQMFDTIKADIRPKLFVVSSIDVVDNLEVGSEYQVSKILVKRHSGHFCSRCWNYDENAKEVEEGTYLCPRCQEVMEKDYGTKRE